MEFALSRMDVKHSTPFMGSVGNVFFTYLDRQIQDVHHPSAYRAPVTGVSAEGIVSVRAQAGIRSGSNRVSEIVEMESTVGHSRQRRS